MKLFKTAFALSGAIMATALYAICAAIITYMPDAAASIASQLMLVKDASLILPYLGISLTGFLSGSIQTFIYTFIFLWLWAYLNNSIIHACRDHQHRDIERDVKREHI